MKFLPRIKDYPKTITLNGIEWDIKFKRKIVHEGVECVGLTLSQSDTILIRFRQGRKETFQTFLHELIHAIEYSYGFEIPHSTVYKLEEGLMDFFVRNWWPVLALLLKSDQV